MYIAALTISSCSTLAFGSYWHHRHCAQPAWTGWDSTKECMVSSALKL